MYRLAAVSSVNCVQCRLWLLFFPTNHLIRCAIFATALLTTRTSLRLSDCITLSLSQSLLGNFTQTWSRGSAFGDGAICGMQLGLDAPGPDFSPRTSKPSLWRIGTTLSGEDETLARSSAVRGNSLYKPNTHSLYLQAHPGNVMRGAVIDKRRSPSFPVFIRMPAFSCLYLLKRHRRVE